MLIHAKARRIGHLSYLALVLSSAAMFALANRYGQEYIYGVGLAFLLSMLNAGWTLFRVQITLRKAIDALGMELFSLLVVRMALFGLGLGLCLLVHGIASSAFGLAFIVLFFVFEIFEVWIVTEWNKSLELHSTGKALNDSSAGG